MPVSRFGNTVIQLEPFSLTCQFSVPVTPLAIMMRLSVPATLGSSNAEVAGDNSAPVCAHAESVKNKERRVIGVSRASFMVKASQMLLLVKAQKRLLDLQSLVSAEVWVEAAESEFSKGCGARRANYAFSIEGRRRSSSGRELLEPSNQMGINI
jgi:hypothetical protein